MPQQVQDVLAALDGFQIVLWASVIIGAIVGIRKAWPGLSRFVVTMNALGDLPELVERIRHQVENDHDTNLREEVTELLELGTDTASKLATITDQIQTLTAWQRKHEEKSDAAVARIAALEDKDKS